MQKGFLHTGNHDNVSKSLFQMVMPTVSNIVRFLGYFCTCFKFLPLCYVRPVDQTAGSARLGCCIATKLEHHPTISLVRIYHSDYDPSIASIIARPRSADNPCRH